jgi:hypothetical protein
MSTFIKNPVSSLAGLIILIMVAVQYFRDPKSIDIKDFMLIASSVGHLASSDAKKEE